MASLEERFIQQTIKLAARGRGLVSPNPMVGAILTDGEQVISKGFHRRFGGPHAEIYAIRNAGRDLNGCTLYVNLEPCVHTGKTGPCVDAILEAGISRVVIGTQDPNPNMQGKGIVRLLEHGVSVEEGICVDECRALNRGFFSWMERGRAAVTLKVAQTLDGKISRGGTKRDIISSDLAQEYVHYLRAQHDAILIGRRTVELDNPLLTVRNVKGKSPKRIILDSRLRTPLNLRVYQSPACEDTIVMATSAAPPHRLRMFQEAGVNVVKVRSNSTGMVSIPQALARLADLGMLTVLVEGGAQIIQSLLQSQVIDDLRIITSPVIFGEGIPLFSGSVRPSITIDRLRHLGPDFILEGRIAH